MDKRFEVFFCVPAKFGVHGEFLSSTSVRAENREKAVKEFNRKYPEYKDIQSIICWSL